MIKGGRTMVQQIGENISRFRQNQNMTQEEFASRLGVTPQAVSKWERGAAFLMSRCFPAYAVC